VHVNVGEQAIVLGLVHQVHDLGLDAGAQRLGDELEDLVQGGEVARVNVLIEARKLSTQVVSRIAPPLWAKCEGEAQTPKSGKLESFGTPKNSKLNCRGQNTSHWGVLGVI
jgi:hypothetical protein